MQQNNLNFVTKGIDLSKLGFKLEDKKMYQSLISPFVEDQEVPHPFKMIIPQSFTAFDFSLQKLDKKNLTDETLIYIFYNVMDEQMQLMAAETLMNDKKHRLLKKQKIWVKELEQGLYFFNVTIWKYMEFKESVKNSDFYTLTEILNSVSEEDNDQE